MFSSIEISLYLLIAKEKAQLNPICYPNSSEFK